MDFAVFKLKGIIMRRYLTQFERVKVGANFSKGGNLWTKRSTKTAGIVRPEEYAGAWFYFTQREPVEILDLSAID